MFPLSRSVPHPDNGVVEIVFAVVPANAPQSALNLGQ
jgi:hypothetical protein